MFRPSLVPVRSLWHPVQLLSWMVTLVGYVYTTLVLWFAGGVHKTALAAPPIRPWYTHKTGCSFADVLRAAQRVLAPADVLDLASSLANLAETKAPTRHPSENRSRHPT